MIKVAIFCGGPSSEHEVSLSSTKSILKNLDRKKYTPYIFYIKKNLKSAFYKAEKDINPPENKVFEDFEKVLKKSKDEFDIALLSALHGEFGEDGTIQLLLKNLNIKYTGSDHSSSVLCMDKYSSMQEAKKIEGILLPKTIKMNINQLSSFTPILPFPFLIKPNSLGSSVLVFIVKSEKEFEKAVREIKKNNIGEILIQQLIDGIELSCGCLENKKGEFTLLPPIEIRPKSKFFDYSSKYDLGGSEEITPPVSISKKESDRISSLTIELHKKLKCRTYSRSDFIYKDGKIYFLETNSLPGMTATSLLPQEAAAAGISYEKLLDFIIKESL